MNRIVKVTAVGLSVVAAAGLGAIYAGANRSAVAADGDVYRARAVRSIGSEFTQVVALSLPAGSYTVTGTAHMVFADKGNCFIDFGPSMATPRVSGYNEASLSGTGTVTLTTPGKVALWCSSERILPAPQSPAANGTLVATNVGAIIDQGTGA